MTIKHQVPNLAVVAEHFYEQSKLYSGIANTTRSLKEQSIARAISATWAEAGKFLLDTEIMPDVFDTLQADTGRPVLIVSNDDVKNNPAF